MKKNGLKWAILLAAVLLLCAACIRRRAEAPSDTVGVGRLMKIAVDLGREVRPNMHMGICGEHGGDPLSIEFCHNIGLTYVSCSPFRVPIARLAAAQAAIRNPRK